jgi:hypothetical protein
MRKAAFGFWPLALGKSDGSELNSFQELNSGINEPRAKG